MGINISGVGTILVICKKCGFILYHYAIGDNNNKNKFNGPPTPAKALSGHDRLQCPNPACGRKLSQRPEKLIFMSTQEFHAKYIIGSYRLINRQDTISPRAEREGGEALA